LEDAVQNYKFVVEAENETEALKKVEKEYEGFRIMKIEIEKGILKNVS